MWQNLKDVESGKDVKTPTGAKELNLLPDGLWLGIQPFLSLDLVGFLYICVQLYDFVCVFVYLHIFRIRYELMFE